MANSAATHPIADALSSGGTFSSTSTDPLYGGFTRFELELEFVQALANPFYLNHLASQKLLHDPSFIQYLKYLQYFTQPTYTRYLSYPGPTLKALALLQQERFRQDILSPDVVARLAEEMLLSSIKAN
ncbi:MAG: hypothetical protein L6R40_001108 [Gallowayella cf. fulva]|nr:MAG: hypothetical protein L6R40_001108 [Xanthomendoza cf. fulva]